MTSQEQEAIVLAAMSRHLRGGEPLSGRQVLAFAADVYSAFVAAGATSTELKTWVESSAENIVKTERLAAAETEILVRSVFDVFGFDLHGEVSSDGRKRYSAKDRPSH